MSTEPEEGRGQNSPVQEKWEAGHGGSTPSAETVSDSRAPALNSMQAFLSPVFLLFSMKG